MQKVDRKRAGKERQVMSEQIGWSDRYGGNWPDPETVCKGPCEGVGYYPVPADDQGHWLFVKCPDCDGTGKRTA